jgi:diguanylate cyclase (GGDEF)-like protein
MSNSSKLWNRSQNQQLAVITIAHIPASGPGLGPEIEEGMTLDVVLAVLLGICASCYMLLALRVLRGHNKIGTPAMGATFMIIGLWVLGGAIELVAISLPIFTVGRVLHFVGTGLVPVGIFVSFREIIGKWTQTSVVAALLIIPVISIVIAATNFWHQFMWLYPATNAEGEYLARPLAWGSWFVFVHAPFAYVVVAAAILTLLLHSSAVAPTHRRGLFLIVGTAMAPIITVVAYDFGVGPDTISIVPLVLAWMLPIYGWLLLGEEIIEFNPLAYETVFQNMQDPVIVVDDQERVIGLNHGAERLLNISENEAMRTSLDGVFGEDVPEVHAALETGLPQKMMTYTGRFLHLQVTPIATSKAGVQNGRVLMFRDVSDVENAQREVQNNEKLLRTLIDHSVNGIIRMSWISADDSHDNRELRCIFANAAAGRILQTDPDEMIHCSAKNMLALFTASLELADAEMLYERFLEAAQKEEVFDTEVKIDLDGNAHWIRVISEPVGEDVAVTFVDFTHDKAEFQQMESIALCDPLTGVLNRRGFETNASRLLSESDDDATGALLFIDLNDFKKINDKFGHEFGDQLLTIAAERLKRSFRSHDIIGRPGGDEFVVLIPDVTAEVAEKLATRLSSALEQPYHIEDQQLDCAAAIGLALYPEHANTLTGLLRAADQAMYRAKARCRGATDIEQSDLLEKAM